MRFSDRGLFRALVFGSLFTAGVCGVNSSLLADTFGSGANSFAIEFVTIGDPGNPPDTTDRPVTDGAVSYTYRIGKYEISEAMIDAANAVGGLGITQDARGPDYPATSVTWFEAARFVNWLNESTGSPPAYKFDAGGAFQLWTASDAGFDPNNLYRNRQAKYFLPSLDEWHKAAYYDGSAGKYYDYPTGSDSVPDGIDFPEDQVFDAVFLDGGLSDGPKAIDDAGLLTPYGTAGQGGNVEEWLETSFDRINSSPAEQRGLRGGAWIWGPNLMTASNAGIGVLPSLEVNSIGLRVASAIPEPATIELVGLILLVSHWKRERLRKGDSAAL